MFTFTAILIVVAYVFLIVLILRLNMRLYKQGEALAKAKHEAAQAKMIVGDLVADERRKRQAREREVIDWLTGGHSG